MTTYPIRDQTSPVFLAQCEAIGATPEQVMFRRARNGDPWRDAHAFQGGWWYVATDGKVDWVPGNKFGFEAVAPIVPEHF